MQEDEKDFLLDDNRLGSEITPKVMQDLKITAGWLRYLGVLGFVTGAFVLLMMFINMFQLLGTMGAGHRYPSSYYLGMFFAVAVIMLTIYLSILLFQYGNSLKSFMDTGKYYSLEEAFEKQKVYWTVAGIMMSVLVGLYFLFTIIGFAAE